MAVRQPHHQREAPLAFANFPHALGADGFDDVEHVARGHAVARNGLRVHFHLQHRLAGELFAGHFTASGNVAQNLLHLVGEFAQLLQIVAVDFDADVGADAGHQLVEAHFNRLAEGDSQTGDFDEQFAHLLHQFGLGVRLLPLAAGFEREKEIRQLDAHGIGRHLGAAEPGPDVGNLVRELRQQELLDAVVDGDGFLDGNAGHPHGRADDGALAQFGKEFAAHARGQEERARQQRECAEDHGFAKPQAAASTGS